jgi:hypothetical protein
MQAPFPIIAPGIFLYKPLWVEKARKDINKIDVTQLDIPLSFLFMPFKLQISLYAHIVCTFKIFRNCSIHNRQAGALRWQGTSLLLLI